MGNDSTCDDCGVGFGDGEFHQCSAGDVAKYLGEKIEALDTRIEEFEEVLQVFAASVRILQGRATAKDFTTVVEYKGPFNLNGD